MSDRLLLVGLAVTALVFGYLGWDRALWRPDAQLGLHLTGLLAAGALGALALLGVPLPRTGLERPILALLTAFAVAALLGDNLGLGVRALGAMLLTAASLPLALLALRARPSWLALAVTLPIAALAVATLLDWIPPRLAWYELGGPGLFPPSRIGPESTPFGSVAVPGFAILATLPVALLIRPKPLRWLLLGALLAVGIPLGILGGSRSAWLATGVAALVFVAPLARQLPTPRRWPRRWLIVAVAGAAAAVVVALAVAPRVGQLTSLVYRGYLWRDTLAAWSDTPLTGVGPGTMAFARQAAAPPFSFPVRHPHSHDLPLGILGDAGVLGLAAAAWLVVVLFLRAGPQRQATLPGRAASAALVGLAVAGLFEDLTFIPAFNLLVILLAAMALTGARAVEWRRLRVPRPVLASGAVAAALLVCVGLLSDIAAIAYRQGVVAAAGGDWRSARAELSAAADLDPWHPMHHKALAVAAYQTDELGLARASAEAAVARNAGDGQSWTNLALICEETGDLRCAERAARQALETASAPGQEPVNAAEIFDRLGLEEEADRAWGRSVLTNSQGAVGATWPRAVEVGQPVTDEIGASSGELNHLVARAAADQRVDPDAYRVPIVRALALAIDGQTEAARDELRRAQAIAPHDELVWAISAALNEAWGEDSSREEALAELIGGSLSRDRPRIRAVSYDIASFRAYPRDGLISSATRLLPAEPWPWWLVELVENR